MSHRIHTAAVRSAAIIAYSKGVPLAEIARNSSVCYQTARHWIESAAMLEPPKPAKRKGSGVIAPAAYHRGSRWSLGRGEGWA